MNIKKILALLLALMMTMSACAFAEAGAAPAEEVLEHDYEVITDPVIITYGDREIHVSEAMPRFKDYYQTLSGYASYGIDPKSFLTQIKQTVLSEMTQELIEEVKIAELGYDKFTEEEQAEIDAQVEDSFNEVYLYYYDYFTYNSTPETDIATTVNEYLEHYNLTEEDIREMVTNRYAANKMAVDLTKDVAVTDEAMQEYYNALVTEDAQAYQQIAAYDEARTTGSDSMILYNPENTRRVLQVLIGFENDEIKAEYNRLLKQRTALISGESLELAEGEMVLTLDEIKPLMADMEAPLKKIAEEVTDKFNNGATIEDLMAEYSADDKTPAEGYYVNIQSTLFDEAFVDAAFSVNEIGQLSAPYAGQHGLYMVYYLADVPAGPVALTDELRAELEPELLLKLQRDEYFNYLNTWKTEMDIQTNIEMFITGYES